MILHGAVSPQENYCYEADIYTNIDWHKHLHACYELIYTIEGYTKVTVDSSDDFLANGEFLLVPPYTVHSFSTDASSKTWIGLFSEDFISSFAKKYANSRFTKFTCEPQIEKMLAKYLFYRDKPEHYMLTSCLYMVCNECEKNADRKKGIHSHELEGAVIQYVTENLHNDVTLSDVAQELGYEYHYLSSLFNDRFSMNFKSFINLLRYDAACRMLADKDKDITTVALECGFGSVRNFNRVFKKMSGMTPRDYKNQK